MVAGHLVAPRSSDPLRSEAGRLDALLRLGILDTAPEERFDRIARLAAGLFRAPMAMISFVDRDRCWIKSCFGLDLRQTPRERAMCEQTIRGDTACIVPDMRLDPRFSGNQMVLGEPGLRFYAGAPLILREGQRIGTVCVMDLMPRPQAGVGAEAGAADRMLLQALAAIVVDAIELRNANGALADELDRRQAAELLLERRRGTTELLVANAHVSIVAFDCDGRYTLWNPAMEAQTGLLAAQAIGRTASEIFPAADHAALQAVEAARDAVIGGEPYSLRDVGYRTPDGRSGFFDATYVPLRDGQGQVTAGVGLLNDATDRRLGELRQIEHGRREGRAPFERMSAASPCAILCADADGHVTSWNPAAERLLGWHGGEACGRATDLIVPEALRAEFTAWLRHVTAEPCALDEHTRELPVLRRDGSSFPAEVTLACWTERGRLAYGVTLRDVTPRHAAEAALRRLAHGDKLTGLANRARFVALASAATAAREPSAIVLIDLDGFKHVNDSIGHAAGDQVLAEAAARLAGTMVAGIDGTLARLGGDEFAVLLPGAHGALRAEALARALQGALAEPFRVGARVFQLGASAGVALWPGGSDADSLLSDADLALYEAKAAGRGLLRVFSPGLRAAYEVKRQLEAEVRAAAEARAFELHYQPLLRLHDRVVVGAEALLRWRHPEHGTLAPAAFLDALESGPLAGAVGDWVIDQACRQAASWRQGGRALRVGVNLFADQLCTGGLEDTVVAALQRWDLPATCLELELAQGLVPRHDPGVLAPLHALRERGVGIAFDDFGAGHASFSALKQVPLTRLKVHRSFVRGLGTEDGAHEAAVVESVLALGRSLKLKVAASGVEMAEQEAFLRRHGCEECQGFLYGRPAPATQFPGSVPA